MKLNMIVGKKQIVLASLVLVLGIAVYLNWSLANDEASNLAVDGSVSTSESDSDSTSDKSYGDAQLVDGASSDDYFAQARLEKETAREETIETLSQMLGSASTDSEQAAEVTAQAIATAKLVESESNIENLIKSKGFEDCVVYLTESSAKVTVKTEGLEAAEAAQIKTIILEEVDIPVESISIVEVA